jgi:hypothetical protein
MSPVVQTVVAAAIVIAAAAFIVLRTVQSVRGRKPGCCTDTRASSCGSCSGCPGNGG